MAVGDIIKAQREAAGMTQLQLSERLGLSQKAVSFYELNQRQVPNDVLLKISKLFGVSTDYLLGAAPQPMPTPVDNQARDILRTICANNPRALAALDRLQIKATGEIKLDGGDIANEAVLQHQIRSLIAALEAATPNPDGTVTAIWTPQI